MLWSSNLNANPGLGLLVWDLGDVDGDGKDDLLADELWWPSVSYVLQVTVYSGATGAILHRRQVPESQFFPFAVPIGDVDADGITEIALTDAGVTSFPGTLRVIDVLGNELFSWDLPSEVLAIENPQIVSGEVAGADLDGDGVPELGFSPFTLDFDKDEHTLIYSALSGQRVLDVEGSASRLGGDFDGDGVDDLLVWSDGGLEAHSAISGQGFRLGEPAISGWQWFPGLFSLGADVPPSFALALPDLDGDGRDELAVADSYPAGDPAPAGRLRLFAGPFTDEVGVRLSPPPALCPCGLAAPGAGCPNSTGTGAVLTARGSTSVAEAHLTFTAHPLAPLAEAVLFVGVGPLASPTPFGAGVRLLTGPYRRVASHVNPPFQTLGLGDTHTWMSGPGPASSPAPYAFKQSWLAGQTYWFQAWYGDPGPGGCSAGSFNLTNAVELTMTP